MRTPGKVALKLVLLWVISLPCFLDTFSIVKSSSSFWLIPFPSPTHSNEEVCVGRGTWGEGGGVTKLSFYLSIPGRIFNYFATGLVFWRLLLFWNEMHLMWLPSCMCCSSRFFLIFLALLGCGCRLLYALENVKLWMCLKFLAGVLLFFNIKFPKTKTEFSHNENKVLKSLNICWGRLGRREWKRREGMTSRRK